MNNLGSTINADDASYMDVMAKSNHVMLYFGYLINQDKYDVYESTTSPYYRTVARAVTADYAVNSHSKPTGQMRKASCFRKRGQKL